MKAITLHRYIGASLVLLAGAAAAEHQQASAPSPLVIGETFTIDSKILAETRRINVYRPPSYDEVAGAARPVLYMPDGGIAEDFLHVAGLLQVSVGNGTMRPFLLVGIENTQRRRDLTGPTSNADDRKIAPQVGGSAAFRRFLRDELRPIINTRYRTTPETAIMGESLAGLFVVETFVLEQSLFDTYIAFDPSVWWNDGELARTAAARVRDGATRPVNLYIAYSSEDRGDMAKALATSLAAAKPPNVTLFHVPMPDETHSTIYHPAALAALRTLFKPR